MDETLDLCDLVAQIDKQCPLKKGELPINVNGKEIPDYIPSVSMDALTHYSTSIMNFLTGKVQC